MQPSPSQGGPVCVKAASTTPLPWGLLSVLLSLGLPAVRPVMAYSPFLTQFSLVGLFVRRMTEV